MDSHAPRGEQGPRKRGYFFTATAEQIAVLDITQGPLRSIKKEIPWSIEPSLLNLISAAICEAPVGLACVGRGDDALLYQIPDEAWSWLRRLSPSNPQLALAEIERAASRAMQNPAIASEFKSMGIVGLFLALRSHALRAAKGDGAQSLYYWFTPHSKHLLGTLHRLPGIAPK